MGVADGPGAVALTGHGRAGLREDEPMRLLWRRRPAPAPQPRPNPTVIAVMEHDLFGIKPEPGTMAAAAIALRRAGDCLAHQPVDITQLGDPGPVGLCTRCGKHMVQDDDGKWRVV